MDLTISAGEFVAVMGPSGSGKSSLLALAGGLDRPTAGGVFVESTPQAGLGLNELARLRRRRAVGYVFQDFNLGASLRLRKSLAGAQSLMIAGLGTLLGIVAGVVPAALTGAATRMFAEPSIPGCSCCSCWRYWSLCRPRLGAGLDLYRARLPMSRRSVGTFDRRN